MNDHKPKSKNMKTGGIGLTNNGGILRPLAKTDILSELYPKRKINRLNKDKKSVLSRMAESIGPGPGHRRRFKINPIKNMIKTTCIGSIKFME